MDETALKILAPKFNLTILLEEDYKDKTRPLHSQYNERKADDDHYYVILRWSDREYDQGHFEVRYHEGRCAWKTSGELPGLPSYLWELNT